MLALLLSTALGGEFDGFYVQGPVQMRLRPGQFSVAGRGGLAWQRQARNGFVTGDMSVNDGLLTLTTDKGLALRTQAAVVDGHLWVSTLR